MSFDVSLEDGVVVSQAHLPIVDDEIVDDVEFVLIGVDVEWLNMGVHEERADFFGLGFDLVFILMPYLLVLLVPL
jgi:hypothetical protein